VQDTHVIVEVALSSVYWTESCKNELHHGTRGGLSTAACDSDSGLVVTIALPHTRSQALRKRQVDHHPLMADQTQVEVEKEKAKAA